MDFSLFAEKLTKSMDRELMISITRAKIIAHPRLMNEFRLAVQLPALAHYASAGLAV